MYVAGVRLPIAPIGARHGAQPKDPHALAFRRSPVRKASPVRPGAPGGLAHTNQSNVSTVDLTTGALRPAMAD
jgi:hypothetical protein